MAHPDPITLSPDDERFARERVASGRAASVSAVVGEALALLREREKDIGNVRTQVAGLIARLEQGTADRDGLLLLRMAAMGLGDAEHGRVQDVDDTFDEVFGKE